MAEVNKTASAGDPGTRSGTGFELRLERGGAAVRLAARPVCPGLVIDDLTLRIPDVRFPFDVGQGAAQFRHRLSDLAELRVTAAPALAEAALAAAPLAALGLAEVRVAFREGFAELAGRIAAGPAFTLKAGLLASGDRGVRLAFFAPRLYGPAPIASAELPHLALRALAGLGDAGLPEDPLSALLRRILAPRGWKLPRVGGVRLARAEITGGVAALAWGASGAAPAALSADPELLSADEGARAFRAAEEAIARGEAAAAREKLLAAGTAAAVHPFAAERLLSLLVVDEAFHEEALDLAADWLGRQPGFPPALLAEAHVRLARGEAGRAVRALAELAAAVAGRGEPFAALAAADTALALPGAAPEDARRAVDVALAVRRDHVPALRALRELAAASGDREALLRADRRLVAYDPDEAGKARAHAELGELLLASDPAAARLHLDHALRLAPEDPAALSALARACAAAGEPLRAVRALDRLRAVHAARGERGPAAAAAVEAGALWEGKLGHRENALLRYREAAELAPSADVHARTARAAEAVGQWAEASDHHAAVLATLDLRAPGAAALAVRTRLALADVAEGRLGDAAAAAAHLEAAAVLAPDDAAVLARLAGLLRGLGRPAPLAAALDRLAPLAASPGERAALLAETGEALLVAGASAEAVARFDAALAADPACRPALAGRARLAADRGDALAERDALAHLAALAPARDAAAAVLHDRLAAASERAGDLPAALAAARAAREAAPTPDRLDAEVRLARRAGDGPRLAALLADAADAAAAAGDTAAAASAWLERARLVAPSDPAAALAALAAARAAAPGDAAALRAQAELAEQTGDARLALGALRALLAAGAPDAGALELRAGRAALVAGDLDAAWGHAERAHAGAVPGSAELLAEVLERTPPTEPARAALLDRLGRHLDAGRLLEARGELDGALAAYDRAADDPATAADALERLAELRLVGGDARGAALALVRLARQRGGRAGAVLALRAESLDPEGAALDAAVDCDPAFAPARARRARRDAARDASAALADAEAALAGDALDPGERPALLALAAGAAAAIGDGDRARAHLAAYCEAAPDDDGALARLAALHRRAGDAAALAGVLARRIPRAPGDAAAALRLELSDLLAARGDVLPAADLARAALADPGTALAAARALLAAPRRAAVGDGERAELLARLAGEPSIPDGDAATALAERAQLLAGAGDAQGALAALRAAAARAPEADDALELHAELAARAGAAAEAATALLERARRAAQWEEPDAAERLAAAALAAHTADLPGAEEALREARARRPGKEDARAVAAALLARARARGDDAAERALLPELIPLLPTGERPAALLRHTALARAAGDAAAARASAEEARTLAPRDAAAVEAARAAAEAEGDLLAVAERLEELATLVPADAGRHRLARARLLAELGAAAGADSAYAAALAALPADRDLADEHAALRRTHPSLGAAAAPLEAFAGRARDVRAAALALRTAAALALEAGDSATALRCARRAYVRTQGELAFAGPLLARLLYLGGSWAEALVLHRRLLEAGLAALAPGDALAVARQLAELAADLGDRELARAALDEVLARRPQDLDAARARFALEPDRRAAVENLAAAADASRSATARAGALGAAAAEAIAALADRDLGEALFERARAAAEGAPGLGAALARERAAALEAMDGPGAPAVVDALAEAAALSQDAGDRGAARALYADAAARAREAAPVEAARLLLQVDALAAADGDFAAAARYAREAGTLFLRAGELEGAAEALERAAATDPSGDEASRLLEEVARAQGAAGAPLLARLLAERAERAAPGTDRADALVALADAHDAAGAPAGAEEALRAALVEAPEHAGAEVRLLARLAAEGRAVERARLLVARAARLADPDDRAPLRTEAAAVLEGSGDPADLALAADARVAAAADRPGDLVLERAAADLLLRLGRAEDAIPHLSALVRADPGDEPRARALADALARRHAGRAALLLSDAARKAGAARASLLRDAATALLTAGDDAGARAALRDAFDECPADGAAFVAALRDGAADPARLDAVLVARAAAVPAEAARCHRARADALVAFGEPHRAIDAYRACLDHAPEDAQALAALAACLADSGREVEAAEVDARILALATTEGGFPAACEAPSRYRAGLAAWRVGHGAGLADLERALALAPEDPLAESGRQALAAAAESAGGTGIAGAVALLGVEPASESGFATESGSGAADAAADAGGPPHPDPLPPLTLGEREDFSPASASSGDGELGLSLDDAFGIPSPPPEERARVRGLVPDPFVAPAPDSTTSGTDDGPGDTGHGTRVAGTEQPGTFTGAGTDWAGEPPLTPFALRELARAAAERAFATDDLSARAAALVESASALERAGADPDELRAVLELACDADPDAAEPWRMRARLESAAGDAQAAARAHLAVSIRTSGDDAARAALEAARLFEAAGRHGDAARAYRVAVHARPGCVPARAVLAEEALAAGDAEAAAQHLAAIEADALAPEDRDAHARKLARALEAAGRPADAEAVWTAALRGAPGDADAFDHAAGLAAARGAVEIWLDLARMHEEALAAAGDDARRSALRHSRGVLLAEHGRLEDARRAFLAALELDPDLAAASDGLAELDARKDVWTSTAAGLLVEAERATDAAEAAALHLHRARILHERLADEVGAALALDRARDRAREIDSPEARSVAAEADALEAELLGTAGPQAPEAEVARSAGTEASTPASDVVATVLRTQAEAAGGVERAELFERLAGHLERGGDDAGTADALLEALEADPERELTWSWLFGLVEGDPARLARARALQERVRFQTGASAAATRSEPANPSPTSTGTVSVLPSPPPEERARVRGPVPDGNGDTGTGSGPGDTGHGTRVAGTEKPGTLTGTGTLSAPALSDAADPAPNVDAAALGRTHMRAGEWEDARLWLSRALTREPSDLTIARDLSRVAEKLGRFEEYVQLGEVCADAIAAYDPLAAAARFRHFAEVLTVKLERSEQAAVMLEKALALVPEDPDARRALVTAWGERPETAPRALEAWLDLARQDPTDRAALGAVAAACEALARGATAGEVARLAERSRLSASLAAFAGAPHAPAAPARLAHRIPPELRDRVAAPGATGAAARLLALLSPWLEPLFPADLARRGASAADRLAAPRAPALRAALEGAAAALGTRPHAVFLTALPGTEIAVENTQPPAAVLSEGVAGLPAGALTFIAARTLDLVEHGWALIGKFAPRDVGILLELACRFAGGAPPSFGLPAQRVDAFLAALGRSVPPTIREEASRLGRAAAAELVSVDPRALAAALRRTANRVALLYAGDPGEALLALSRLDRRIDAGALEPAQALALPDLRDVALFALSDPYLELRLAVLG